MTGAEFDTRRRVLGLSVEDVATLLAVQHRLVQRWIAGSSPVPDFAGEMLDELEDRVSALVDQLVETLTRRTMAGPVKLLRYRTADDYAESIDGDQLPFAAQPIYVAWAADALAAEGVETTILWNDEVN